MQIKLVLSQRVESDATPCCQVSLISSGISSVVTPGGDRVADMDIKQIEKVGSVATRGTKGNPRK